MHACKSAYLQNGQPCFLVVVGDAAKLLETLQLGFGAHRFTTEKLSCAVEYLQGSCTKPPPTMFDETEVYFEHMHKLNMADVPSIQLLMDKGLFT